MKTLKTTYDYLHMLLMLMACLIVTACNDDDDWQEPAEYLNISIYSPQTETRAITRAGTDTHDPVKAETEENTIHDVYVWAFLSTSNSGTLDSDKPIGYVAGNINAASGNIQMPITEDNLNKLLASDGKVDFYVIANTANLTSFTLPDGLNAKRADVRDATFGHIGSNDDFGGSTSTNADTWYTDNLSGSGLPSANTKTEDVVTDSKELTKGMISIQLLRAVSRLRFVFSRATDLEDVEIEKIEISGSGIYKQEKLFYTSEETTSLTGETEDWNFTQTFTNAKPEDCDDPKSLVRNDDNTSSTYDKDAQAYETRIDQAISNRYASEYGRTYIRETNAPLTATITFRCEQTRLTKTVTLRHDTDTSADNLPRNHTWLVYGYFEKGSLQLTATVMDWKDVEDDQTYTDNVTVIGSPSWAHYASFANNQVKLINGTAAELTFNINTPKGGTWYATLVPIETEDVNAIGFVTTDATTGKDTYSLYITGDIGGEQTIKVKAKNETPSFKSKFKIMFGVRNEGGQSFNVAESLIPQYIILQDLS